MGPGSEPPNVRIIVDRPADEPSPSLAKDLTVEIATATERDVIVRVEFVGIRMAEAQPAPP